MPGTPPHHARARTSRARVALAGALLLVAARPAVPRAQAISGSVGYDYYSGPLDQITRTLEGFAAATIGAGAASVTLSRFDDSIVGSGIGVGAGAAIPIAPTTRMRVWATSYTGDASFSGWRLRGGPQLRLATGQTLALYAAHYEDNVLGTSNSVSLAFGAAASDAIDVRASAGFASGIGVQGAQGSIGMSWTALRHLELSGDVGMSQGAPVVSGGSGGPPARRGLETSQPSQGMVDVGVRVLFP